ncbi:MAG: polysaccharide biosynthesis C-terminal domain-containing protein [Pseudomonadales bacterium]|nr:polysaccharide biosynthesis C-terminal domain-containing protein [Pseudomonadales bacterium]
MILRSQKLRQILLYTIPNVFSRGIGFLLLPLYAKYLEVNEFGQMALLAVIASLLNYMYHLGWGSAYLRYYREKDVNSDNLNHTMLTFRLAIGFAVIFPLIFPGPERLAEVLVDNSELSIGLLSVFIRYLIGEGTLLYTSRYRMLDQAGRYALVHIFESMLSLAGILYFFVYKQGGINAIFFAQMLSAGAVLLGLMVIDNQWLRKGRLDRDLLFRCLKFGLPLVPGAIAMFLMTASDRYMLKWLLPEHAALTEIGYYAFAFRFVAFMQLLTVGFNQFFSPFVYKTYTEKNAPAQYAFMFRVYATLLFVAALGICAGMPALVNWIFPKFESSLPLLPVLLCGFIIYNVGDYFCIGVGLSEKTKIRAYAGIITALTNVILNALLIPVWGAFGAALTTTLSYFLFTAILMYFSQKYYHVPYAWTTWLLPIIALLTGYLFMSQWRGSFWIFALLACAAQTVVFFRAGGISYPKVHAKGV